MLPFKLAITHPAGFTDSNSSLVISGGEDVWCCKYLKSNLKKRTEMNVIRVTQRWRQHFQSNLVDTVFPCRWQCWKGS